MKKCIFIILLFSLFPINLYAQTYSYNVSNKSLNSMACPAGELITDVFVSEKSMLKLDTRKDRLFFEFTATRYEDGAGYVAVEYAQEDTTMIVFCGDEEYAVTLKPRLINGVSIELPHKSGKVVKTELDGLRREEQLSKIVQMVLADNTAGFNSVPGAQVAKLGSKEVYLRKIHSVGSYKVKELYVFAEESSTITEDEVLNLGFIGYPVAMTLHDGHFIGWLRIIVIEDSYTGVSK